MVFTVINITILLFNLCAAIWVWRDGHRRRDPWAPTWALATYLFSFLGLLAYLLHRRGRPAPSS